MQTPHSKLLSAAKPARGAATPVRLAAAVLFGLLSAACDVSDGVPPSERFLAERMAAAPPSSRVAREAVLTPVPLLSWNFGVEADRRPWKVIGDDSVEETAGGFLIESRSGEGQGRVRFHLPLTVPATRIDTITFAFTGEQTPMMRLDWARADEPCRLGQLRTRQQLTEPGEPAVVRFFVADDPDWDDRVERICLAILSYAVPAELQRAALIQERHRPGEHAGDVSFARVQVAGETRPGWVGSTATTPSWEVEVPATGRLEFGFGTTAHSAGSVEVRVRDRSGEQEVFDADVGSADGLAANRWHDRTLDLGRWAGGSVELLFATSRQQDARGLLLWSEPKIWVEAERSRPDLPNLVVVSIDTLRPDHLPFYGYPTDTAPNLTRWANGAVVFENAVSSSPWTLPAHLSMFTGLDALRHGVNHRASVPASLDLLAPRLQALGYETLAVTGGGYMHADLGLDRGFDRYRSWADRKDSAREIDSTVATALRWLEEKPDRPIFLLVHTYEVHHPFRQREPYFSRFSDIDLADTASLSYLSNGKTVGPDTLLAKWPTIRMEAGAARTDLPRDLVPAWIAAYDSGIAHADDRLGPLFSKLDDDLWSARTASVLISDHGEALGEHGLASHMYLDDFNALVPLVVKPPGASGRGHRVPDQVRLVDLFPTLLELSGAAIPDGLDGASLLPLVRGEPDPVSERPAWTYAAFSRRGMALRLDNRWKYRFNNSAAQELLGREQLHDLVADPDETVDLAPSSAETPRLRRRMLRYLMEHGTGVRLRLSNPTEEPIALVFVGPDLQFVTLKAVPQEGASLHWSHHLLRVDLEPGGRLALFVERLLEVRLTARIRGGPDDRRQWALGDDQLGDALVWGGDGVAWSSDVGSGAPILEIDRFGPSAAAESGDQSVLQQQLEALGYLN